MAFEQIEAFLKKMQSEPELKNEVVGLLLEKLIFLVSTTKYFLWNVRSLLS
jgi:hypothetical protein